MANVDEGSENKAKNEEHNASIDVANDNGSNDSLDSSASWFTPKR